MSKQDQTDVKLTKARNEKQSEHEFARNENMLSNLPVASESAVVMRASSLQSQANALQLLNNRQRHVALTQIAQRQGNNHVQRVIARIHSNHQGHEGHTVQLEQSPASSNTREDKPQASKTSRIEVVKTHDSTHPTVQRSLREDMHGQWDSALVELNSAYGGVGGVVGRQMRAVQDFTDAAGVADQPSLGEQVLIGGVNLLLGAALGGIGTAMKAIAARAIRPVLRQGTRATMGTAVDSADFRSATRASVNSIIDKMVEAGKGKISNAVRDAWQSGGSAAPTALLQFRVTQMEALEGIARQQISAMNAELARLRSTEGEDDEWEAADTLYASFRQALDTAYNEQYNKMTDIWVTLQTQTIGLGARPGVLQIRLTRRYPHEGGLRIEAGNLYRSGVNDSIRSRLARRPLQEIAIPKVIRMNGKMGWGIQDCDWHITATGTEAPSSGPAYRAPQSSLERLTAGPQGVDAYTGNRWGLPWLAAHHLGLNDLGRRDQRNSSANRAAGARAVWDAVKDLTPGSIGNSGW
jgi:hypothetical protein